MSERTKRKPSPPEPSVQTDHILPNGQKAMEKAQISIIVTIRISSSLQYIALSPSIEQMTGLPAKHYLGKTLIDTPLFASKKDKLIAEVLEAIRSEETKQFFFILKENQQRYYGVAVPMLNPEGRVEEVALSLRALQNHLNENNFRKLFEQSPIGICFIGQDKHILEANPALLKMWGYSKEELLTKTMADVTHPEDIKKSVKFTRQIDDKQIKYFKL